MYDVGWGHLDGCIGRSGATTLSWVTAPHPVGEPKPPTPLLKTGARPGWTMVQRPLALEMMPPLPLLAPEPEGLESSYDTTREGREGLRPRPGGTARSQGGDPEVPQRECAVTVPRPPARGPALITR